jgi:hypothetical protein
VRNKIGNQGFVSEPGSDALQIDSLAPISGSVLTVNAAGTVQAKTMAGSTKYGFWDYHLTQTIPTDPTYAVLRCNGQHDFVDGGLSLWNTQSNVFQPTRVGEVYSVRITGKTGATGGGGTGVIHIDFALSGATPPNFIQDYNRQKQGYEVATRASVNHIDINAHYTIFTDDRLVASGGQFYTTTTHNSALTLMSMSVFIKEG